MSNRFSLILRYRRLVRPACLVVVAAALATLVACNNNPKSTQQEDAEIQRRSAEATAKLKVEAAKAEVVAKAATKGAARRLNDVALGVRQGIQNGAPPSKALAKPPAGRLDLNSASAVELATLPGISGAKADAIIAARPYASPRQLVKKGIVTAAEYQRIAGRLTAR